VAYHVAVVHPDDLNVRTSPSEDTDVIDVAHAKDELEVVAYDNDWMKVALGDDVYGYINAYYVDYKTYYPQAETLEEEQARLEAEAAQREAEAAWAEAAEEAAFETEWTESSYENETEAAWEDSSEASGSETEPVYTESAAAENTSGWTETGAENSGETYEDTGSDWTASDVTSDQTDAVYTETEAVSDQTEPTDTESGASDQTVETEAPVQESASTDSSLGQQIADYAVQFVGNPYVWGGTSLTSGADCSGFTQSVFANFGISLARVAADQSYGGTSVSLDSLQPGDLLFYSSSGSIDHVAIYIGSGMIVHAANSRTGITTSSYNYSTPVAARRYF
jgi:cell wall-associated NlpC family hydrolase